MKYTSLKDALNSIQNKQYKMRIYIGRIVHKVTENRYIINALNPLLLSRLSFLYKFKIHESDFMYNHLVKSLDNGNVYIKNCFDIDVFSIHFLYLPNKCYDLMIYQYNNTLEKKNKREICEFVYSGFSINCIKFKTPILYEVYVEVEDINKVLPVIFNLSKDVQHKINNK